MSVDLNNSRYPWLAKGEIPILTGLRAIAILFVLIGHGVLSHGFPFSEIVNKYISGERFGHFGVSIFFVLSGFLITVLIIRECDRSGMLDVRGFYVRRMLRIFPAYVVFLGCIFLLRLLGILLVPARDFLISSTYTVNLFPVHSKELAHFWTLSIEEQFYIVWPILLAYSGRRFSKHICLMYLSLSPIVALILLILFKHDPRVFIILEYYGIAIGCLLALVSSQNPHAFERFFARYSGCNLIISLLLACCTLLLPPKLKTLAALSALLDPVICAYIMSSMLFCASNSVNFFNSKGLATLGRMSYSIYIWQQLFLYSNLHGIVVMFPFNYIFAIGCAAVSYFCVERPFLVVKNRISKQT